MTFTRWTAVCGRCPRMRRRGQRGHRHRPRISDGRPRPPGWSLNREHCGNQPVTAADLLPLPMSTSAASRASPPSRRSTQAASRSAPAGPVEHAVPVDTFGGEAEVVLASHHWPMGRTAHHRLPCIQRDLYAYLHYRARFGSTSRLQHRHPGAREARLAHLGMSMSGCSGAPIQSATVRTFTRAGRTGQAPIRRHRCTVSARGHRGVVRGA